MHLSLDLTLPADHTFVRTTRRVVAAYLDNAGLPHDLRDDLVLAVGEACSNAVQHAFPDGEGLFRLVLDLRPNEIVVEVSDTGVGFQAFDQANAHGGSLAPAGRGIEIMRRLVGAVEVESPTATGGTRIRLHHTLGTTVLS
ncbi:MAG TPA: ATP-binding protein [Acidimicrobiales bacterium]|nr:ATP-binding protein [Acidimicrobiales bacterium]